MHVYMAPSQVKSSQVPQWIRFGDVALMRQTTPCWTLRECPSSFVFRKLGRERTTRRFDRRQGVLRREPALQRRLARVQLRHTWALFRF